MLIRPAGTDDVATILALAHTMKRRLAKWSPVYFNPREGAEELHAAYLEYLVGAADHDTRVIAEDGVVGFFAVVEQAEHHWVDDLYLSDTAAWPEAAALLAAEVAAPWVTCASHHDHERAAALGGAGLEIASTFWARSLTADPADPGPPASAGTDLGGGAAPHTFGPGPFDPAAPGALVIGDGRDGYVVGSPGVEPPLYDPGGPSCVVDRVVGHDRGALLTAAVGAAAARGNAGLIVVCDHADDELAEILVAGGFRREVDLFGLLGPA